MHNTWHRIFHKSLPLKGVLGRFSLEQTHSGHGLEKTLSLLSTPVTSHRNHHTGMARGRGLDRNSNSCFLVTELHLHSSAEAVPWFFVGKRVGCCFIDREDLPSPALRHQVPPSPQRAPSIPWGSALPRLPCTRGHLLCSLSVTKSFPDFLFPLNSSTRRGEAPSGAMGSPSFTRPKADTSDP